MTAAGQAVEGLEHESGLADTRVAADQNQRTGHDAPAQDPVEFRNTGQQPFFGFQLDGVDRHRRRLCSGQAGSVSVPGLRLVAFLGECIPTAAIRALAHPLGRLIAARLANKNRSKGFFHGLIIFRIVINNRQMFIISAIPAQVGNQKHDWLGGER